MQHYPLFLNLRGERVVVAGGGEIALAKLRLLTKTEARITVIAPEVDAEIAALTVRVVARPFEAADARGARLVYAASGDAAQDAWVAALARAEGALVNVVDDLAASDFLTPAIVDRDPVIVAIGTEGTAPVLARRIKARVEEMLPQATGTLARVAGRLRDVAEALPHGRPRREVWGRWFDRVGPDALRDGADPVDALGRLIAGGAAPATGRVLFVGAGPGDPDHLTMKARRALDEADVVIHDRLVAPAILELARREARIVAVGKEGFGPSTPQAEIDALIVAEARAGALVVRLKGGDPVVFGRLDEEIAAVEGAGLPFEIIPGLTAATVAAAAIGQSLTQRGRNGAVTLFTGQVETGEAEQDWRALAEPGHVAALYMGKRAARRVQGKLMMHGADGRTPVTVVENVSRPDQRVIATTLAALEPTLSQSGVDGPAVILIGLAPRAAAAALSEDVA